MTPPTYSPWLKVFEGLARLGLGRRTPDPEGLSIGDIVKDAGDGLEWQKYVGSQALFEAWGPRPESPWSPFHRPTLFAVLDKFQRNVYPARPTAPPAEAMPRTAPSWAAPEHAVVLDLPGEAAVAYGAWLARVAGYQPVATFNNWPHRRALVKMERVLGSLLYYADLVDQARKIQEPGAPPAFLLDSYRMGDRTPEILDFDNRYYLMDSDLPSGPMFRKHGIQRVVYVRPPAGIHVRPQPSAPSAGVELPPTEKLVEPWVQYDADEMDDMNRYLHDLRKVVGLDLARVDLTQWDAGPAKDFAPAIRPTPFNTSTDPRFNGFRRSAAGGFGVLIPEPGSGG